jgi:hypothetical protein
MERGTRKIIDASLDMVDSVQEVITEVEHGMEERLAPVRKNLIERFPVLFMFITTAGFVLVLFSMEAIFADWVLLQQYPWVTLGIGVSILVTTGTLYKKLS